MLSDVNRIKLVSKISPIFQLSNRKAKIIKFDLAVKYVKVTPGSSFEETSMGRNYNCYISSFVEIVPPVPEKKIFEGFFTIYGRGGHLGHVTSTMSSDF